MSYTVSLCIIYIVTGGLRTKVFVYVCMHMMQARAVQLPLVVMTLDAVPIDVTSLH